MTDVTGFTMHPLLCAPCETRCSEATAEYMWTWAAFGTETALCASCCAAWRTSGKPYLAASRIRSVPRPVLSVAPEGSDPADPQAWTPAGTADALTIEWSSP